MPRWLFRAHPVDPAIVEQRIERSRRDREFVDSRWPMIRAIAADLAAAREQNNFAARIRAAYERGQ